MSRNIKESPLTYLQTNVNIGIEIISPTHIGAGQDKNWKKGLDYFVTDGNLYVVDKDSLCTLLINRQGNVTNSAFEEYLNLLSDGRFDSIENLIKQLDIDLESISIKTFNADFNSDRIPKEIKTIIRDGFGKPYIPGSSIKGAIRSVLFHHLFRMIQPRSYDKRTINKEILGDFERGIMRYILPGDAEMPETEISEVELFNLYHKGGRWYSDYKKGGGFPFWTETFSIGQSKTFRLGVADGLAQLVENFENGKYFPTNLRKVLPEKDPVLYLFKLINDYTQSQIQREIDFFENFEQASDTDVILGNLDNYLKITQNNPKECLLRLSFGSGFHGMTGDWRFSDHLTTLDNPDRENLVYNYKTRQKEPARYKSRRIADTGRWFAPMGFVKLSLPVKMQSTK